MNIRKYRNSDFETLDSWWRTYGEPGPLPTMLLEDSTLILELDNKPVFSVTVYTTNCNEFCYAENFISDPELKGSMRREAAQVLAKATFEFAKSKGFKRIVGFSYRPELKERYQDLGLIKTLDGLSSFMKELN